MSKIIFMGTPDFAVPALLSIFEHGYEILLVITQPDKDSGRGKKKIKTPVKEAAEKLGVRVFQPNNINSRESIDLINSLKPDFIIVSAYGQILKEEVLNAPKFVCLNIHASLLPKYRGAAPINWSIINGDKKTGITIMKMEKGLDNGPMYMKEQINIEDNITAGELFDRLKIIGAELIIKVMDLIEFNNIIPEIQNDNESTYAPMLSKSMRELSWDECAINLHNRVRGLDPWPGTVINYKDKKIKIFDTVAHLEEHANICGTIVETNEDGIKVACKDGYLLIKEIQLPAKKRMNVKTYLLGNKIEQGYILRGEDNVLL